MNELTERLTASQAIIMGGSDPTVEELHNRLGELGYVLVAFTQTRGGTELGFPLDVCELKPLLFRKLLDA